MEITILHLFHKLEFLGSYNSVFYHHTSLGQCIYLIVYVNDIVITDNDQDEIQRLKQHLFSNFQTKDLGKLKYFLRIEIA